MEVKRISDLINEAFSDETDKDYAQQYADNILENWKETSSAIRRSATFLILTIVLFELLARAAVAKLSLGPLEIQDLSLVRKALPVLIAYFYYELWFLSIVETQYQRAHDMLMAILHKPVYERRLQVLLRPRFPLFIGTYEMMGLYGRRLHDILTVVLGLPVVFGPLLFLIYAFMFQFRNFDPSDPLLWMSLIVTIFLLVYTFISAYHLNEVAS